MRNYILHYIKNIEKGDFVSYNKKLWIISENYHQEMEKTYLTM